MPSVRTTKKNIEYVLSEVVSDCLNYLHLHKGVKDEEVIAIIEEMIDLKEDLYSRCKHIDGKDNSVLVKIHFRKVYEDLLNGADAAFEKLSVIVSAS
ncbi:MAG: hypothetical protein Q7J34_10320 [Bacteroidales bacterium]|nr:hypothetical protein [Bacteroidales bacterium]